MPWRQVTTPGRRRRMTRSSSSPTWPLPPRFSETDSRWKTVSLTTFNLPCSVTVSYSVTRWRDAAPKPSSPSCEAPQSSRSPQRPDLLPEPDPPGCFEAEHVPTGRTHQRVCEKDGRRGRPPPRPEEEGGAWHAGGCRHWREFATNQRRSFRAWGSASSEKGTSRASFWRCSAKLHTTVLPPVRL